jgi:hypothetical protein
MKMLQEKGETFFAKAELIEPLEGSGVTIHIILRKALYIKGRGSNSRKQRSENAVLLTWKWRVN